MYIDDRQVGALFFVAAFLCLLGTRVALAEQAQDLGRFLDDWNLISVKPPIVDFMGWEDYQEVKDKNFNYYTVRIAPRDAVLEQLGISQFATAVGVMQSPTWVTLVRRGQNGFVKPEEIPSKVTAKVAGSEWVPAFVSSRADTSCAHWNGQEGMSAHQLAQLTIAECMDYLLEARAAGVRLITPTDAVFNAAYDLFGYQPSQKIPNLRERMKETQYQKKGFNPFPTKQLMRLASEGKLADYEKELGEFFDRLEGVVTMNGPSGEPLLDELFGPTLKARGKEAEIPKVMDRVRKRALGLRAELQSNLKGIPGLKTVNFPKSEPSLNPYIVKLKPYLVDSVSSVPKLENGWRHKAKDFLMIYILAPNDLKRSLEQSFGEQLGSSNPLAEIAEAADVVDRRVFLNGRQRFVPGSRQAPFQGHLWNLNQRVSPSLVVVSPNDEEALAIRDVATRIRARVGDRLQLYDKLPDYPQGKKLEAKDLLLILAAAQKKGLTQVIICELGGRNAEFKQLAQKQFGINLVFLDHHNNHVTKVSALEQFAAVYGYQLELPELVKAIFDRSGINGLRDIGISVSGVRDLLKENGTFRWVSPVAQAIDPLLRDRSTGKIPSNMLVRAVTPPGLSLHVVKTPFEYLVYPDDIDVLFQNRREVRFCGSHEQCANLRKKLEPHVPGTWYGGTDMTRGWVTVIPSEIEAPNVANLAHDILTGSHAYSCEESVTLLSVWPGYQ